MACWASCTRGNTVSDNYLSVDETIRKNKLFAQGDKSLSQCCRNFLPFLFFSQFVERSCGSCGAYLWITWSTTCHIYQFQVCSILWQFGKTSFTHSCYSAGPKALRSRDRWVSGPLRVYSNISIAWTWTHCVDVGLNCGHFRIKLDS